MSLLFYVHSFPVVVVMFFGNGNFFAKSRFFCQWVKIGRKVLIFEVSRLAGKVTVAKTRQSMPAGRLPAAIGRHSTSAGRVTMPKTEHSPVVGRLTTSVGRVTAFAGKLTLSILRVAMFVGKLPAGVGRVGLDAVRGRVWL
jgi:hypothetical protein